MSRSEDTIYRQWVMLTKIPRYPRKIAAPDLKSSLEGEGYMVDLRTIQRDLNKLSISFPLSYDTEGRKNYWFWIQDASIQDMPGMEPVTALAFEMAQSFLTPLLPKATLDILTPYFKRAKEVLNDQSESTLRSWPDKVKVIERGPVLLKPNIKPEVQQVVYQALLEEKIISASYLPRGTEKAKNYLIHPLGIVSKMGVIYLICTLWDYSDIKQFALHRFISAEITKDTSNVPNEFSLGDYTNKDIKLSYPQQNTPIQLKVLFEAEIAHHLAETPLSATQSLVNQENGTVLLQAEVMDTLELRWWLQGFGDNIEVVEPKELREKFASVSSQLFDTYK